MDGLSWSLLTATASLAVIHTVLGPDHYLPFILLARARGWSAGRATAVTAVCGIGHVVSSLVLGSLGVALGLGVTGLERLEGGRGSVAAWLLLAFGLTYGAWGLRMALRHGSGLEPHTHGGHVHLHRHAERPHRHEEGPGSTSATFWPLFTIFVLGPCEPLIPIFVLPAGRGRWELALLAAVVFGVATVGSMIGLTLIGLAGLRPLRLRALERYSHSLAGGVIAASGLAILLLGW